MNTLPGRLLYTIVSSSKLLNINYFLSVYNKTQYLHHDLIQTSQLSKLKSLINYSKCNIPYYNNQFSNLDTNDLRSLSDISIIPKITKSDLRLWSKELKPKGLLPFSTKKTTGGSTGSPFTIVKSASAFAKELAATWRGYSWAGIKIGMRQGRFWNVPIEKKSRYRSLLIDLVANRYRTPSHFDDTSLSIFTRDIIKFRPDYFYGYCSLIKEYAKYLKKTSNKLPFSLHAVISTSEHLDKDTKHFLSSIYRCPIYNEYGLSEVGTVAHECDHGTLHVSDENVILEIIPDNSIISNMGVGEIVVTELNNKSMPLIRYRTGDYGAFASGKCACGRTLTGLRYIGGRTKDLIQHKTGHKYPGGLFGQIFMKTKTMGVSDFQVQQLTHTEFVIRLVPDKNFSKNTKQLILKLLHEHFDPDASVTFQEVSHLPKDPSGKFAK
jgi:phenylacetate-CoA ligase